MKDRREEDANEGELRIRRRGWGTLDDREVRVEEKVRKGGIAGGGEEGFDKTPAWKKI